jgi:hypothetical protein
VITLLLHYADDDSAYDRPSRIIQVYSAMVLMDLAAIHGAESAEILGYEP